MKRTLNETGRLRIEFEDFEILVKKATSSIGLTAAIQWDIAKLNLDPNADVVIEILGRGLSKRFEVGKVDTGIGNATINLAETEEAPSLRLEIFVSLRSGGLRRILASSSSRAIVVGGTGGTSESLLPVKIVSNAKKLWSLDYSTGRPILEVSNAIPGAVMSSWFRVAVLPQVIKELYMTIAADNGQLDVSVCNSWVEYYKSLGVASPRLDGSGNRADSDNRDFFNLVDDADDALERFTTKFDLLDYSIFEKG